MYSYLLVNIVYIYSIIEPYYELSPIFILRNLIIAPISEEIVFRALMVSISSHFHCVSIDIHTCHQNLIYVCPIYFGFAHIHHFYEKIRSGSSISTALIGSIVQFTYTYIFGVIAVILFLRTNVIYAPIVSHIFCNMQGLPTIDFMYSSDHPYSSNRLSYLYPYRYIFLLFYIGGIICFCACVYPFTNIFTETI